MQNTFVRVSGGTVIFDTAQLLAYTAAAVALLVIVVLVIIAVKSRKKSFIKTIPTNLKDKF